MEHNLDFISLKWSTPMVAPGQQEICFFVGLEGLGHNLDFCRLRWTTLVAPGSIRDPGFLWVGVYLEIGAGAGGKPGHLQTQVVDAGRTGSARNPGFLLSGVHLEIGAGSGEKTENNRAVCDRTFEHTMGFPGESRGL